MRKEGFEFLKVPSQCMVVGGETAEHAVHPAAWRDVGIGKADRGSASLGVRVCRTKSSVSGFPTHESLKFKPPPSTAVPS